MKRLYHFFWSRLLGAKDPRKGIDPRRFWRDEVFPALPQNTPLFSHAPQKPLTLTYKKESRDCIYVAPGETITLPISVTSSAHVRWSIATEGTPEVSQGISIFRDEIKEAELTYVLPHRWHHVRMPLSVSKNIFTIKNSSSTRIALAHPMVEHPYSPRASKHVPKNIILLLLDSLVSDAIGIFNPKQAAYTPHIDDFFSRASRYTNTIGQSEWTYPSIYSFLMSRYPLDHGMVDLKLFTADFPQKVCHTFPERLQRLGYSTLAYSTSKVFHPAFGAHLGFDRFFYDPFPQGDQTHRTIVDQAVMQLENNREGKNFLFLHFFDSHEPWTNSNEREESMLSNVRITDPMKEYESYRRGSGDTKAEPWFDEQGIAVLSRRRNARLAELDASLHGLFDYLKRSNQREDTAVMLISDHGSPYLGRGAPLLCASRVEIPFLLDYPRLTQGKAYHELVALNLDLAPTILALAGDPHTFPEGTPVWPFADTKRTHVISESIFGNLYKAAVRDHNYVYHFCCSFDPVQRKIHLHDVKSRFIFERKNEEAGEDLSDACPQERSRMHEWLLQHLHRFPNMLYVA